MLVVELASSRPGMALGSTIRTLRRFIAFVWEIIHDPKSDPLICPIAISQRLATILVHDRSIYSNHLKKKKRRNHQVILSQPFCGKSHKERGKECQLFKAESASP